MTDRETLLALAERLLHVRQVLAGRLLLDEAETVMEAEMALRAQAEQVIE